MRILNASKLPVLPRSKLEDLFNIIAPINFKNTIKKVALGYKKTRKLPNGNLGTLSKKLYDAKIDKLFK